MTTPRRKPAPRRPPPPRPGSPAHPSPGASARSRTGATSSPRAGCSPRCSDVGLSATELGPDGFLPADPDQMAAVLAAHHLTAVGGFTPVLMHRPGHDPLPEIDRILDRVRRHPRRGPRALRGVRARRLRHQADPRRRRLGAAAATTSTGSPTVAAEHGVRAVLHPHVGHHGRERRRGPAGARGLLHLAVPGHRAPADRRHRPGGADPPVPGPHRPHPPQGRRQHRSPTQVRAGRLTYTEAVVRGHVPAAGHRRRRRRGHREHPAGQRLRGVVHPRAGHHPHRGAPRRGTRAPTYGSAPTTSAACSPTRRRRPSSDRGHEWNHCGWASSAPPASPSWPSSSPSKVTGTRLVAVAARDPARASRVRRSPRHRAGSTSPTSTSSTTPRSRRSTTRWPTACTRRWNKAALAAESMCSPRSPPPATPPRPRRSRPWRTAPIGSSSRASTTSGTRWSRRLHAVLASGELGELRHVETVMDMPAPDAHDPRWSLELGGRRPDGPRLLQPALHARPRPRSSAASPPWSARPAASGQGHPGVDEWAHRRAAVPERRHRHRRVQHGQRPPPDESPPDRHRRGGGHHRLRQPAQRRPAHRHHQGRHAHRTPRQRSSYTYQLEAFTTAVRTGVPARTDAADAVRTMRLIDTCYEAVGLTPRPTR